MLLLNIFLQSDGSFAWDNISIIILAVIAGYLLHRFAAKRSEDKQHKAVIAEWESKHKRVENEYKSYKSSLAATDKHNEKTLVELNGRVKALEGDIRVLADEKNKFHHQLAEKEQDVKKQSLRAGELEDQVKSLQETATKANADWAAKLQTANAELSKALVWEERVKHAEEEAQKAKATIGNAERKKLEAELRLKATAEYAGKIGPMEAELAAMKEKYNTLETEADKKHTSVKELEAKLSDAATLVKAVTNAGDQLKSNLSSKDIIIAGLQEKLQLTTETTNNLKIVSAQLELQRQNNTTQQQELAAKHSAHVALIAEMESVKASLRKLSEENEQLKKNMPAATETANSNAAVTNA